MAKTPGATRSVRGRRQPAGQSHQAPDKTTSRAPVRATPAGDEPIDDPTPPLPSSLDLDQRPSAARSGRAELEHLQRLHRETSPALTAGDVDADWVAAYSVGDEAPGGDNPTPGQTVVDEVGKALGVEYADGEELTSTEKIETRDRHRWELDPASSEDYPERTHATGARKKPTPQAAVAKNKRP